MEIKGGFSTRLGATYDGEGTNFALFSSQAEAVELCLFDASGTRETHRVFLPEQTHDVWHGYVPGLVPGAAYGYRVHGRYDPPSGQRFNPGKLLLDPYAKELTGTFIWHESHFGYDYGHPHQDLAIDLSDNAPYLPKGVVCSDLDCTPLRHGHRVPWHQTVIYETHVRGFTLRHPEVPELARGCFAGLSAEAVVAYLKALGITTVELMPVQAFIDEYTLHQKGLKNYWGYNTLNFFSPHPSYLSQGGREEFKAMVNRFHDAGIEVILDVVYNHTCEGNHLGPTLSFRGIDNMAYYQLMPGDKRFYINDTGCGNTLNIRHPRVLQMVLDSLRYWAGDMGVDGFRFDLASVLGRQERGFSPAATFFQALAQDPVLANCKLIAEPWDLGPGGYQLGNFPPGWSEWNDHYRDSVRRFWRGDPREMPELARRLHGSGDIFEHTGRRPSATINFVTSHDGFTLRDLVSYNHRHNEANLENNEDGHRGNYSANHGVEGDTDDPDIDAVRWRQQRNFLATLIVSQGVPMMLAGDEFGRSQRGNNNAYCQDNELNWIDWTGIGAEGEALAAFTRKVVALRSLFPVLQASEYRHLPNDPHDDSIRWLNGDGSPMREEHWHEPHNQVLGYLLTENSSMGEDGVRYLLVLFNGSALAEEATLPTLAVGQWRLYADTAAAEDDASTLAVAAETNQTLAPRSLKILLAGTLPPPFNPPWTIRTL